MADPDYPLAPVVHTSPAPILYPGTEPPAAWVATTAAEAARFSGATRDQGVSGDAVDPWLTASLTVWALITGHLRCLPPARADGGPPGDLAAVARSATTRYGVNPTQARQLTAVGASNSGAPFGMGPGTVSASFMGWLLAERLVLDRYRQTWR